MAATLTHNYAALRLEDGSYVLVGGRHREPMKKYDGIWSAKGNSWRWNDNEPTASSQSIKASASTCRSTSAPGCNGPNCGE